MSITRVTRIHALVVALSAAPHVVVAAQRVPAGSSPDAAAPAAMSPRVRAVHVLNRLAFGGRPGDIDRVLRLGVNRWIEQQLYPESIVDASTARALEGCTVWIEPLEAALTAPEALRVPSSLKIPVALTASSGIRLMRPSADDIMACRLTRAEASERQLLEVMTDFWENHFSVYRDKTPSWGSVVALDRASIQPNALGRFRDLLGAVAHSPAMLHYLDNAVSMGSAINENYARELLELHTMGVDGGYTQADVVEVARAFTGWTHSWTAPEPVRMPTAVRFVFDSTMHDTDAKVVLGVSLGAGREIEDGEAVLDLLARHPSTARFIARKLVVRFVSDAPPPALVDRATATFLRTDGDIREVMRTIVTSTEFNSTDAFRAKVKSPIELVLSLRRAMDAPVDVEGTMMELLEDLHQTPWGRPFPDGWPETASPWMGAEAIRNRIAIATRIGQDELPTIQVKIWGHWASLAVQPFDVQVDGVVTELLGGELSRETRDVLLSVRPANGSRADATARKQALRELIALALSSPEFQHR